MNNLMHASQRRAGQGALGRGGGEESRFLIKKAGEGGARRGPGASTGPEEEGPCREPGDMRPGGSPAPAPLTLAAASASPAPRGSVQAAAAFLIYIIYFFFQEG